MEQAQYNLLMAMRGFGFFPCYEILNQAGCDPVTAWFLLSKLVREQLAELEPGSGKIPFAHVGITERGRIALFTEQQERARKESKQLRSNQVRHKRAKKRTQRGDHKITGKLPVIPRILHVLLVFLVSFFVGALASFLMRRLTLGH